MPKQIGKYAIQKELGHGGMGVVYRATDPVIGRDVAIKMLLERALEDPTLKKRVYREARSAGRLSHENIMTIYDVGEEGGHPYLVMELLDGTDLREVLHGPDELSLDAKLDIALQIARGLRYAHDHDTIHRDIKPANIRICANGRVKILDFGIAKIQTETRTVASGVVGTPRYMSPEQVKGESIDHRTDIFSFGVLLYEVLTGMPPFRGDTVTAVIYKILHTEPDPVTLDDDRFSDELQRVVARCLKKEVAERYQDFGEVIEDLEEVRRQVREDSTLVDPPTQEPPPESASWWTRPVAAAGAAAVLIGLALGVWAFQGPEEQSPPPLVATGDDVEEVPVLQSSVEAVHQRMETARSAADAAGASGEPLYAQAERSAEAGREAMAEGTESGLEEAREAFVRAEGLYEAAAAAAGTQDTEPVAETDEEIEPVAADDEAAAHEDAARRERLARRQADQAKTAMQTARQAIVDRRSDAAIAADFDRAEALNGDGQRRYETGDYSAAASSFEEARTIYAAMERTLGEAATRRQGAEQARSAMVAAKNDVPGALRQQATYQQAVSLEQDGDRAFEAGTYEQAASHYAQAQARFEEAAEAEAPPPALADVARSTSQAVQQRLADAIETADWSGLPGPVTSLYQGQVDGIRSRFNIKRVVTVPGGFTPTGDETTATQPMTVYIHYTQKGRTEEKTVSLAHTWVWARAGTSAELIRIQ